MTSCYKCGISDIPKGYKCLCDSNLDFTNKYKETKMKYYKELAYHEQQRVLDNLQSLPLFNVFRNSAHDFLMTSELHMFDENLGLHTLAEPAEKVDK